MWRLAPEHDYSLVDVPAGTKAHRSALSLFFEGISETRVDISVLQVQNSFHMGQVSEVLFYLTIVITSFIVILMYSVPQFFNVHYHYRQKMYLMKKYPSSKEPLERHPWDNQRRHMAPTLSLVPLCPIMQKRAPCQSPGGKVH